MPNWTKEQRDAFTASGGSILVSAAAGSGKTAVLVQRIIRMLTGGQSPVDADRLLVATFSNAAASEMKERVARRLDELIRENPQDAALRRQKMMLSGMQIGTIHSFCLNTIKNHFHLLDISPDFKIADESQLKVLREEAAEESIERFYAEDQSGDFSDLVELLSSGRDDKKVAAAMVSLYDFIRSHPFYEDWLDEKAALYDPAQRAAESVWGGIVLSYTKDALAYAQRLTAHSLELILDDEMMRKAYESAYVSDLAGIERLAALAEEGDWDALYELLHRFQFERLGSLRKYEDVQRKTAVGNLRKEVKSIIAGLAEKQFCCTEAEFAEDILDLRPKVDTLFRLTKDFADRLESKKREKKWLDFSDLEQYTLRLLVGKDADGCRPTALAKQLSQEYEEILVDECQDTNEVQDLIFRALSRDEKNLFMVGDVKQSIYRFRQAMPELFLARKNSFHPYDGSRFPAKINLNRNFRSKRQVTDGINFIFEQIMSEALGELDYNDEEKLICGADYQESEDDRDMQLLIADAGESEADKTVLEARLVAEQIARMAEDGYMVRDGNDYRRMGYGDVCILLRSPKNKAKIYADALKEHGIPVKTDTGEAFLYRNDISIVISMLKVIDNPLQDVAMLAVLLSPMFGFTPDDLTRVRLSARTGSLYTAMTGYREEDETAVKIAGFLDTLSMLRRESSLLPVGELVQRIYDATDFEAVSQVMDPTGAAPAHLRLLRDYAKNYTGFGRGDLGSFIRFVNRMLELNADFSSPGSADGAGEAVRIMSIHHSKGLEFPVCFVSDTAKRFNREDLRGSTLIHSRLGFALVRRDLELMKQFTTLPKEAVRLELEKDMLSEELRVLYVALTRSKQRLIITAALNRPQKKLGELAAALEDGTKISPYVIRKMSSYLDWVLLAALRHPDAKALRTLAGMPEACVLEASGRWTMSIEKPQETAQENEQISFRYESRPDEAILARIQRQTAFRYPYESDTLVPTKLSVSQLLESSAAGRHRLCSRPQFAMKSAFTPAERGTILHRFMQFCSYEDARTDVRAELARMISRQYLTEREGQEVDVAALRKFFESPLAERIFASPRVHRELRFYEMIDSGEIAAEAGCPILVQGVADCVFEEGDGFVIVDYKTDQVSDAAKLTERYARQLVLYRRALEKALKKPCIGGVLYAFALGEEVRVF
ncbi:helicase-exonuclease AddAB subunit AddA [Candidatus Soleaferrea massiliensis]|uniref:helicase-exonuclease AddAB subunit AddA n=1 Tax=Candidatus Soleaferrea massiliensis TaxID=1470354 RepID=UPI00058E80EF|nr:helicase-exonuclease AddAB subunit AddA [Candidatus Soleaferrea massiliensis]